MAFLADLREAFGRGRRAAYLPSNCVILLDNAHTEAGVEFLRQLTQVREGTDPDPITVVATALPDGDDEPLAPDDVRLPPRGPIEPWLGRKRVTVWLPDLSESQVEEMARAHMRSLGMRLPPYVPRVIYQFTLGHPWSTEILIDRLRDRPDRPLLDVLDDTMTQHLLDGLLDGFPAAYVSDLATCAAARDPSEMNRLAGLVDPADLEMIHDHWPLLHGSGDGAVLQPVLRRLLLRELAARDDDAEDGWLRVFSWLRDQAGHDEHARHYHALALGDFEPVVGWLDTHLGDPTERPEHLDVGPWLAALRAITAAPVRHPPTDSPHEKVNTSWTGRWDSRPARLAYLVAGLQLASDPLTGPDRRTLHEQIAGAYLGLTRAAPAGREVFQREAARHQELAKQWPTSKNAKP